MFDKIWYSRGDVAVAVSLISNYHVVWSSDLACPRGDRSPIVCAVFIFHCATRVVTMYLVNPVVQLEQRVIVRIRIASEVIAGLWLKH